MTIFDMTKKRIIISSAAVTMLAIVLLSMYSGNRLDEYVSRDPDEQQIVNLMSRFHKAGMQHDLATYLACLSEDGEFMFSDSLMVSKDRLGELLPPFWKELESGNILVQPNSRESLNGNFLDGELYNPIITLTGDEAEAVVTFVTPIMRWKTKLFLFFHKRRGSWLIYRFVWDMG